MARGSSWRPKRPLAYDSWKPDYSRDAPSIQSDPKPERDSQMPEPSRITQPTKRPRPKQHESPKTKSRPLRSSSKYAVNPIKTKIRDLTRLLERDLTADVRVEKERALAGYQQDLEHALQEKRKEEMISKYHMVRFFERQKATRGVKKCKKSLAECVPGTPEHQKLQEWLHVAEVDLNYAQYSPLYQKYEALYPRKEAQENDGDEDRFKAEARPAMWKVVEKSMEEGTLEALREGSLDIMLALRKPKTFTHTLPIRSHIRKDNVEPKPIATEQPQEMDEDSDGGFFEEAGGVKINVP